VVEEEKKKVIKIRVPRISIWMATTLILLVVLAYVSYLYFKGVPTNGTPTFTAQQAANKTVSYINKNLITTGSATLVSTEDVSSLYKITASYQGQNIPVYVTKDGRYLILQQGMIDMNQQITTTTVPQTQKKDKPTVELFVMAFCPYGVQAETIMKPVFDLLGTKADIKIRFIATIQGNTTDSVQSLHGATEAQEDLRQVCIMKYYDQKTYWNYLMGIDNNCYGTTATSSATVMDACWKSAAVNASIDITKIQTCSNSTEGLNLLKADEQLTTKYGVSGSPTLVINGVEYAGARSSEAFKQGICNGFTTPPTECNQTLSSSGSSSPSAGCAT